MKSLDEPLDNLIEDVESLDQEQLNSSQIQALQMKYRDEAKQEIKSLFMEIALEICENQPITYEKFKTKIEDL